MNTITETAARPAEILLVEDNEDDVLLTRRVFRNSAFPVNLRHVENGRQCMDYLRKQGEYAGAPTPDMLLLDLNMPVMTGREVMAEIVNDPLLRKIPVVVLTTSRDTRDLEAMYNFRCSSYIAKPVDFIKFQETIEQLREYWFGVVELPPRSP